MTDGNNGLLNPERVFWELSPKLPDRCILAADSGTSANWYARDLKIRRGMMASGSGNLASMGAAVPYAVGAKFCFPDRVCIAVTGDGAMQMNGLNACITVAKYWHEWSDPRWITLVLNNRDLNQVTWEQRIMMGDIRFVASQELPDFPYAAFADSIGLLGIRVEEPDDARRRVGPGFVRRPARGCGGDYRSRHSDDSSAHYLEASEEFHRNDPSRRSQRKRHHQAGDQGHGARPRSAWEAVGVVPRGHFSQSCMQWRPTI